MAIIYLIFSALIIIKLIKEVNMTEEDYGIKTEEARLKAVCVNKLAALEHLMMQSKTMTYDFKNKVLYALRLELAMCKSLRDYKMFLSEVKFWERSIKFELEFMDKQVENISEKIQCLNILGLSPNVNFDEVKKRYRELVKQFHPDVSSEVDAKEVFIKINDAYNKLRNLENA